MDSNLTALLARLDELPDDKLTELATTIVTAFDVADAKTKTPQVVALMEELSAAHDTVVEMQERRVNLGGMRDRLHAAPVPRDSAAAFNATPGSPLPPKITSGGRGLLHDRYKNEIVDHKQLAEVLTNAFSDAKAGQRAVAFSAEWRSAYPEDRRLTGDPLADSYRMNELQTAVVASGGVCNPVDVSFDVAGITVTERPLRDGLPSFLANRGGLRFVTPVTLAATASATTIWTEAIDANPGTATKPVLTVNCPNETEIFVDAVPTRLKIGNMQGRFFPEWVENFTETALAAAARTAELNLLQKISTQSTAVSSAQLLGASRDFVATVEQATAAARYRHRASQMQPFTLVLPAWARNLLRADLARELAHDTQGGDPLAIDDARIDRWFAVRQLRPIWTLESTPAVSGGAGLVPFASQQFGNQTAGTALIGWPAQLVWWIFPSGTWQFLDGGSLNLGIVRDTTLDATNDYEVFVETFENVAFRGLESLQIASTVRPNGASAGSVQTATSPLIY